MAGDSRGNTAKLALAIVLLVVAGAVAYFNLRSSGPLPDRIMFVCVATGETFHIARDKVEGVPMKNPRTSEATLLPCYMKDGSLHVDPHYRAYLRELGEKNRYVDKETLAVRK